jgi:6-phosphogluconate dehydrogenase (decarboxylating)
VANASHLAALGCVIVLVADPVKAHRSKCDRDRAGITAAYAEGLNILRHANAGNAERAADAETTPLWHPELYQYDLNLSAALPQRSASRGDEDCANKLPSALRHQFGGHEETH